MKKSWNLIPMILSGKKTIESRWYKNKSLPWGKIKKGDIVYFKDSGGPITVKAKVQKVIQFENLNNSKTKALLKKYGKRDLGTSKISKEISDYTKNKKYAIFVYLSDPKLVKSFNINKKGFGIMSAWITVHDINSIKI